MKIIVSVDQNWCIGYQGDLLLRIPEDMKFFKRMTVGRVIVMGRGTFESLPGGQPLKDRTNIVLSSNLVVKSEGVIVSRTLEDLIRAMKPYDSEDLCIIGGEQVFNQLLPYCKDAYVTKINRTFPADRYFMNLDENPEWELISEGDWQIYEGTPFKFVHYQCQNYQQL